MKRIEPTIEATETDKAYAAGFVDGEAHIIVTTSGPSPTSGSPRFNGFVGVTQQDRRPLEWMQARWGGSIFPKVSGWSDLPCWRLNLTGQQAAALCCDLLPFLQVKAAQAENLIAFAASRPARGVKGKRVTDAKVLEYQEFVERSKELNKRGAI